MLTGLKKNTVKAFFTKMGSTDSPLQEVIHFVVDGYLLFYTWIKSGTVRVKCLVSQEHAHNL